jgi:hypothetical protein
VARIFMAESPVGWAWSDLRCANGGSAVMGLRDDDRHVPRLLPDPKPPSGSPDQAKREVTAYLQNEERTIPAYPQVSGYGRGGPTHSDRDQVSTGNHLLPRVNPETGSHHILNFP